MSTGLRARFRSIVTELALGTVESLISRFESVEDLLLDSSDFSDFVESDPDLDDLDPDLDDVDEEEDMEVDLESFLDENLVAHVESFLDENLAAHDQVPDDELPAGSIFDERLCPIALVDSETGSPVIVLKSHKEDFGASCRLKLPDDALHWATCQVVGIQVSVHEYVSGSRPKPGATPCDPPDSGGFHPDHFNSEVVALGDINLLEVYTNKTRSVYRHVDGIDEEGVKYTVLYSTARRVKEGEQGRCAIKLFERWADGRVKRGPILSSKREMFGLFRRDTSSVPLYGRNLRINEGANLFVANGWTPLSEFTADKYTSQITGETIGHPGLRGYPMMVGINTGLELEMAMGPTGHERAIPYYVSVSLVVRLKKESGPRWGNADSPLRENVFSDKRRNSSVKRRATLNAADTR